MSKTCYKILLKLLVNSNFLSNKFNRRINKNYSFKVRKLASNFLLYKLLDLYDILEIRGDLMSTRKKFRKKPIIIEAYQTDKELIIQTPEGCLRAMPGDWIITGVEGEQYPCKPDVFEKTYEPIDDNI